MTTAATVSQALARIEQLMRLGQWDVASTACGELVALAPLEPEAWSRCGIVALVQQRFDEADLDFGQALLLAPQRTDCWTNRSIARFHLGRYAEAEGDAKEALARDPAVVAHWLNLGACLSGRGKWSEAAAVYQKAAEQDPRSARAWSGLGAAHVWLGDLGMAEACYQKSLGLEAENAQTQARYACLLLRRGQIDQALELLGQIIDKHPSSADAWSGLGNARLVLEQYAEAEAAFRQAIKLAPANRLARRDLVRTLIRRWALAEAEATARQLVSEDPAAADGWDLVAAVHWSQGRVEDAVAARQRCVELEPNAVRHSGLLCEMQYAAGVTLPQLLATHQQWDAAYARQLLPDRSTVRLAPHVGSMLRIGFVSADFGRHPTGCFVLPVIESLDRGRCHVVCYSDRVVEDEYTHRFRAASDQWRVTHGMTDDELAAQVRHDEIDVLFDLMGHTGQRLTMFARKPAPLQISWFGYVGTTGLTAIDFLLADRHYVRAGEDALYSERILRMPNGYACYQPPPQCPDVASLPALHSGHVTFGCFNNPAKFSDSMLDAWATILRRTPQSELLLKYGGLDQPDAQNRIREIFEKRGVSANRIVLEGGSPHAELLARYRRVDLGLDTQPFSGCTTTCEALWMGVPVITFPGQTFAGRHSTSHLINAGYPQFVSQDLEGYVELAIQWAGRLAELAAIRGQMREQVRQSPLCDAKRFARDWLDLLLQSWESHGPRAPTARG